MNFISPQTDIRNPGGRPTKYPWYTLAVGDSFFVPGKRATYMNKLAKLVGVKVRCKTVMVGGAMGCRVWRIA